jgi:ubiquinone/menaquinone biosynthesis C-methylase UbiE
MSTEQSLILDVGCGANPKGTVNIDFVRSGINLHIGGFMKDPQAIANFVVADACHLPFKNEAFNLVFSSHVIEHVSEPTKMFDELCRVAKAKVIVRCPHKVGSGAKRQHHLSYFDEAWFKQKAESIGLTHSEHVTAYDFPISNRLPNSIIEKVKKRIIIWKILRHIEFLISRGIHVPYEVECQVNKIKITR